MTKYTIDAVRTHWYTVEVDAADEVAALDEVRDWMADDFEDYETRAEWNFEAYKND